MLYPTPKTARTWRGS